MYNAKNYTEQGGNVMVIGGELKILAGCIVTGLPQTALKSAGIMVPDTED